MMNILFAILEKGLICDWLSIEPNKTEDEPCKARDLPQPQIILIVFQTGPYGNKEDYGLW